MACMRSWDLGQKVSRQREHRGWQTWVLQSPKWRSKLENQNCKSQLEITCENPNRTLCCQGKATQSRRPSQRWGWSPWLGLPGWTPFPKTLTKFNFDFQTKCSPAGAIRPAWRSMCSVPTPRGVWGSGEVFQAFISLFHIFLEWSQSTWPF